MNILKTQKIDSQVEKANVNVLKSSSLKKVNAIGLKAKQTDESGKPGEEKQKGSKLVEKPSNLPSLKPKKQDD